MYIIEEPLCIFEFGNLRQVTLFYYYCYNYWFLLFHCFFFTMPSFFYLCWLTKACFIAKKLYSSSTQPSEH
uniref:Uncharacterized protein n=1 Tax=Anguilla anguilla TaxID=7936 RepID=A0A0E9QPH6_ANGAN